MNFVVGVVMVGVMLHLYASLMAEKTFEGEGQTVNVTLADEAESKTVLLLGTTGQFLFLYEAESRQVTIHPNESIHSISFTAPVKTSNKKP